ncbi:formimidoyltransferase-cyclodeaminase-like [Menidia menidia]
MSPVRRKSRKNGISRPRPVGSGPVDPQQGPLGNDWWLRPHPVTRGQRTGLTSLTDNMAQLVECVPNFSEGRNKEVIDAIAAAILETPGCSLLDVDPGASTNRTVYTFVGPPGAVVTGAMAAARRAHALLDMSRHKGEG